jgi:hypothetical protein
VDVHTVNRSASQFLTKADSLKWKCEPQARDAVSVNSETK